MKRKEISIADVKTEIKNYYRPGEQHFIVMNAVDLGENMEVQWFFTDYTQNGEITAFCAQIKPDIEIPSIRDIIASAWVAEAELVDLMNIKIENTEKGFVLEPDFERGPLRKKK